MSNSLSGADNLLGVRHRSADNEDEAEEISSSPNERKKPRIRTQITCLNCTTAQLRCDERRPCSRCVSEGQEDQCRDASKSPEKQPAFVGYDAVVDELISTLTVEQVRTMIMDTPLKYASLLGFITRLTSEDYCNRLKQKFDEMVPNNHTGDASNQLKVMQPQEFEFKHWDDMKSFLSPAEIQELSLDFGSIALARNSVAVLKVSRLPHKNGPHAIKQTYNWTTNLEEIVGVDFFEDFKCPDYQQLLKSQNSTEQCFKVVRSFWKIFSENSFEQFVKFMISASFNAKPKQLELMEVVTATGELKKFWIKWKVNFFPLIELVESVMLAIRI